MNDLKEYLKRELGVTDEQYKALVDKAREDSPLVPVKMDGESVGKLISFLIQHDEAMSQMLNMVLMRVMQLENKVKGMEENA